MKQIVVFLWASLIVCTCSGRQKPISIETDDAGKWSVKMADAVMTRFDTLAFYNHRKKAGWSYDVAMLGMAIHKLGDINPKYAAYMKTYMDMLVDDAGNIPAYNRLSYNIDFINPARNLILLFRQTGEEKYRKALPQFIRQMEEHPKTKTGGYWHKKRYPWQIWLDGVYMGMPFLTMYARDFDQPQWFDIAAHEIKLVYEKTIDTETGLLYHAWDESREQRWANPETGRSPHFWSRAMGWYVMALVDVLDDFPETHPDRAVIINLLQKTIDALLRVRDPETGCWFQVLDQGRREGNYLEGSGTAMYVYAMAKGAKKGYLDKKYLDLANETFDDLVREFVITDDDGLPSIVRICASCGLGGNPYRDGSYEYYTTEKIQKNDSKGVGPFILAAFELGR